MSEEWSEWIEHDGKGCPCVGAFVHVVYGDGFQEKNIAGSRGGHSWHWKHANLFDCIIRYRIRKPRGLTILENLLSDLPAPVKHEVEA